jgi:hypothetical protein
MIWKLSCPQHTLIFTETAGNSQGQNGEGKQNQKNPFEDAFETGGYESPHGENNRESTTSNNSERRTNNSDNGSKESSSSHNKNDDHNNNDKYELESESGSTSSQVNNKKANQPNDKQTAPENPKTTPTRQPTTNDQSKIPLQLPPKASTSNERLPNGKMKEVSRNCSIRGNKTTSDTKRQASSRVHTERKPLTSTRIPNKVPYVQNSVIKYQDVGKERAGFRAIRAGSKPKQANVNTSHICVSDLESVLGANVTELREIIMKYKSEKADTAENSQGKEKVAGSKLNPQRITGDNLVDGKKSRCKNNKSKDEKSEMIDNKGNCDSSLLLLTINYGI